MRGDKLPLTRWMRQRATNREALACMVGLHPISIWHNEAGRCLPSARWHGVIWRATGGEVTLASDREPRRLAELAVLLSDQLSPADEVPPRASLANRLEEVGQVERVFWDGYPVGLIYAQREGGLRAKSGAVDSGFEQNGARP